MRNAIHNIVLGALLLSCGHVTQAQTENVVYRFAGRPDGANPYAGVTRDKHGNFYGTTMLGGAANLGTVFKVTPKGTETVIHSFSGGADGSFPSSGLVFDRRGNLFGTTPSGGASNRGTVFMLSPSGKETVVYNFAGGTDGAVPSSGLILDKDGNLYGTTGGGGRYGYGTVFGLSPSYGERVLYSFTGGADGSGPAGGLAIDGEGNLYGMTQGGGAYGYGAVFELTPSSSETVLHSFIKNTVDGIVPSSGLVRDTQGNLYGTTSQGGQFDRGTVFKVTTSGVETVLFSFYVSELGYTPAGNLLLDKYGNLYGTTLYAAFPPCYCGAVFKLSPPTQYSLLYDFTISPDGANPNGYLVFGAKGHLYGTTQNGGTSGKGTVFELIQ